METILLVDDDLGFVFWLGRLLDGAGYAAFPAKNIEDGRALVAQCRLPVDLLIINAAAIGLAAFVKELRISRPALEVIVVDGRGFSDANIAQGIFSLPKPERFDAGCREELLEIVESVLGRSRHATPFGHLA